jgi:hypothetical protein
MSSPRFPATRSAPKQILVMSGNAVNATWHSFKHLHVELLIVIAFFFGEL